MYLKGNDFVTWPKDEKGFSMVSKGLVQPNSSFLQKKKNPARGIPRFISLLSTSKKGKKGKEKE